MELDPNPKVMACLHSLGSLESWPKYRILGSRGPQEFPEAGGWLHLFFFFRQSLTSVAQAGLKLEVIFQSLCFLNAGITVCTAGLALPPQSCTWRKPIQLLTCSGGLQKGE